MAKNPLKPLSPEAADQFSNERQTADVIQRKCPSCSAWYETIKSGVAFEETITCDCGAQLKFHVPASETRRNFLIKASTEDVLSYGGQGAILDTGMKAEEAIKRTETWWEKTGKREMRLHHARQKHSVAAQSKGLGGSFSSLDPSDPNFLPSGIIHGKNWDDLGKREKLFLVKVWHHNFVRIPDKIGQSNATIQ